jgi:hypothetical protein
VWKAQKLLPKYQQLSTDLTMLKGITATPTQKSAQAREAMRKLAGDYSCLKWRIEVITRRFPNTASTVPKPNTAYTRSPCSEVLLIFNTAWGRSPNQSSRMPEDIIRYNL